MKYVCTVCGYVYEGESLPADFVPNPCTHGRGSSAPRL